MLPTPLIHSYTGPEHCDWQTVTFLTLGPRQFVRDAVYAVDRERMERWPALREMIGCA